jgi:hypothetical protein
VRECERAVGVEEDAAVGDRRRVVQLDEEVDRGPGVGRKAVRAARKAGDDGIKV